MRASPSSTHHTSCYAPGACSHLLNPGRCLRPTLARLSHLGCLATIRTADKRNNTSGQAVRHGPTHSKPDGADKNVALQALERRKRCSAPRIKWAPASFRLWSKRPTWAWLLSVGALPGVGMLGSALGVDSVPGSIVETLGVLAVIVAVHETGHFLAARWQGIHVLKFAIGFGPPLLKFQRKEVEYSLRAIPLGGYVAFPDDDPDNPFEADDPDLLRNRSIPERALVISAGVLANLVFAFAVLFTQVGTVGKFSTAPLPGVRVVDVVRESAAASAGFKTGDIVMSVQDYVVDGSSSQVASVVDKIQHSTKLPLQFTVQRGSDTFIIKCEPDNRDGISRIGVQFSSNGYVTHIKATSVFEAFSLASTEFVHLSGSVFDGLKQIFLHFGMVANQLSGPVAIVAIGSQIARTDLAGLLSFAAVVSINLAVVNVLPIPGLDGGYLFLLLIEALRGKKLPQGLEQGVMASGLIFLMALGVLLVIRDTMNLL